MISHRPISGFLLRASKSTTSSSIARLVTMRCFSSSGDEIKTGTIKYYNYKDRYGFIIPDGVDKDSHDSKDLIFIHQNDIKKQECANEQNVYPVLRKDQRVAFKVSSPTEGVKRAKAFELTLENGDLIPPFEKNYLEKYTKRQKIQFGEKVFEIMSTCSDQQEMEAQIVAAFDDVKQNIERQRSKMKSAGVLSEN